MKGTKVAHVWIIFFGIFAFTSIAEAQVQYDELTYPELNEFQRPEVETFQLENGIRFFLLEDRELPLIDLSVTVRTGSVLDPPDKTGLASLTGTVMRSGGTQSYPADTLNTLLENRAARMETGIGFTSGSASMNVLKEDFDELLPVFIDLLRNPAFPEDKIELAKTQIKSGISRRNDNPQQVGIREFERLIYGANSVYGRLVEYETVNNIQREDLVNFHRDHFTGANMLIGVVGDFDAGEMRKKLTSAFGSISAGTPTMLDFPKVSHDFKSTINFVNKPDVNQSFVLLGHIGGMRENPDYAHLQVLNQVLSNGLTGRLFKVVRTELGLAYAVFGEYGMNSFYPGMFYAGVMTKSSTTADAIDAIIEQLKRLQNEPISESELSDVKDQFLNSLVFRYDSYEKVLGERISNEYRGLSEDAFNQYVEGVKATTIEDVQRVAREYLRPEKLQILVVGNKQEIGDQLQKYGEINEIDITIPQPGDDQQEVVKGDPVKGSQLLEKMADALITSGTDIKSLTVTGEVTQFNPQMPGGKMTMRTTATITYPDAVERTIETPGGPMNLSYKNGSGTLKMMGQERPLPPPLVQSLKAALNRSYIAIALNHERLDPQYLGAETYGETEYAKVSVSVNGSNVVLLIDEQTGYPRLMRYEEFNPQQGQTMKVEEQYSNWQTKDGVAFAYKEVSFSGGEKASEASYESHQINNN